jgi:hypothetical protein
LEEEVDGGKRSAVEAEAAAREAMGAASPGRGASYCRW